MKQLLIVLLPRQVSYDQPLTSPTILREVAHQIIEQQDQAAQPIHTLIQDLQACIESNISSIRFHQIIYQVPMRLIYIDRSSVISHGNRELRHRIVNNNSYIKVLRNICYNDSSRIL